MTSEHLHAELSAYIDSELDQVARAAVDGHLTACSLCRAHLAQLRATTSLIGALPDPLPRRRLVPRLTPPLWLAPMRTVMTLASGAAVFLFIASAVGSSLPTPASGGAATTALEANRERAAQAPAAAGDAASPTNTPTPSAAPGAAFSVTAGPTAPTKAAVQSTDGTGRAEQVPAATAAGAPQDTAGSFQPLRSEAPNPLLWLGIAIFCGAIAYALHRRLRTPA